MKKYFLAIFALLILSSSCSNLNKVDSGDFGVKVDPKGAIDMKTLVKMMEGKEEMNAKVRGLVTSVCQVKGCWMTLDVPDTDEDMMIRFKDYGFFMPFDLSGKEVVCEGVARRQITTVAELQHYAEDKGASPEEIAQITEDKLEIVFEAAGVYIK